MSRRRHGEDSVLASIGQVQDMLREEAHVDVAEVPTEVTVTGGASRGAPDVLIGGVPSAAEIERSRTARWAEDAGAITVVRTGRLVWLRRLGFAAVLLGLGSAAGWGVASRTGRAAIPIPLVLARLDQTVSAVVVEARMRRLGAEVGRLTEQLELERSAREAAETALAAVPPSMPASAAPSGSAPVVGAGPPKPARSGKKNRRSRRAQKKGRARSRRSRRGASMLVTRPSTVSPIAPKKVRRKPTDQRRKGKRLNSQDKRLDSLIDGL